MDPEDEEHARREYERERELHWKRYSYPSRRKLHEDYNRARGDADLYEGRAERREADDEA